MYTKLIYVLFLRLLNCLIVYHLERRKKKLFIVNKLMAEDNINHNCLSLRGLKRLWVLLFHISSLKRLVYVYMTQLIQLWCNYMKNFFLFLVAFGNPSWAQLFISFTKWEITALNVGGHMCSFLSFEYSFNVKLYSLRFQKLSLIILIPCFNLVENLWMKDLRWSRKTDYECKLTVYIFNTF